MQENSTETTAWGKMMATGLMVTGLCSMNDIKMQMDFVSLKRFAN